MNTVEEWRPVVETGGAYEVSDFGRVRVANYRGTGCVKILKCGVDGLGYRRVGLWNEGVKLRDAHVHSLVASAFIGERPEGYHVNHKSGDKMDNTTANLEYCTAAENLKHALRSGLMALQRGTKNIHAKLDEEKVREIRRLRANGEYANAIAKRFGVSCVQIGNILKGKVWGWVT